MEIIRNWLNGPRLYEEGVSLYSQFGNNNILKKILASEAWSQFKEDKLVEALKQLMQPEITIQQHLPAGTNLYTRHAGWPPHPIEDPVLRALHAQWKPLYSEMMNAQSRVYEVALLARKKDSNKRLEACQLVHRIMDLDDEIDEIYGRRDYYLQHRSLPDDPQPVIVGDPVRWATELNNALRYVRRYKQWLQNQPDNVKWASKLKHFTEQVSHYKKLLKLD